MQHILVTGGSGYIGAHMVKLLLAEGYNVHVLDNLSGGIPNKVDCLFTQGDCGDAKLLDKIFSKTHFDGVMHFAGCIEVGESVQNPAKYYDNNVTNTIALLNAMVRHAIPYFVFSSSAAVYGASDIPLTEMHPCQPLSPYGYSKKIIEEALEFYEKAYNLRWGALRYFNVAGADPKGDIGEAHHPETHLIPRALDVVLGKAPALTIYGSDYPTPDGSCIRDYIHVNDVASAHLSLFRYLHQDGHEHIFNLGTGKGYSVFEVMHMIKKVTGNRLSVILKDRREGDPAILVADAKKAFHILGWQPAHSDLEILIRDAWRWHHKQNEG